ncbi:MAG: hypothetical protein JWM31_1943 [Solirubrobacterales bacterium]|nr:hypothetical protein [Solirubrobacterales bacterium]
MRDDAGTCWSRTRADGAVASEDIVLIRDGSCLLLFRRSGDRYHDLGRYTSPSRAFARLDEFETE